MLYRPTSSPACATYRRGFLLAMLLLLAPALHAADPDAYRLQGDFDGDGTPEYWRIDATNAYQAYLSSGRIVRGTLRDTRGVTIDSARIRHVVAGDFDGDRRDDLRVLTTNPPGDFIWNVDQASPFYEAALTDGQGVTLDPAVLRVALAADFNGDGRNELRGLRQNSAMNYVWGMASAPLYAGLLTNTADAQVNTDLLRFVVAGDFDGDGQAELRGLQSDTSWNYIWKLASVPVVSSDLADTSGTAVTVNGLRHVLVADFDGDGHDELRGLRSGGSLNYVWKSARLPIYQGNLENIAGAPVPVDALNSVFTYQLQPGQPPLLAGFQAGVWYYLWGLAPLPLDNGPLTNSNDVADLRFETPWTAPQDSRDKPLVVANYFLGFTGAGTEVGSPRNFSPAVLSHQCGDWDDATAKNYWQAPAGQQGFLSYGPYKTMNLIKTDIQSINNRSYGSLCYRIDFQLMVTDNSFSATPLGYVDVTATDTSGTLRTLYKHNLFPQDFAQGGVFSNYSYQFADYVPRANEQLEFRVYTNGARALALQGIRVFPLAFDSVFGGWTNVPWNGGLDVGYANRIFDPHWLLTSDIDKNGVAAPLPTIAPWRRDIVCGHLGFYPYIGPYDQRSEDLLRYQIRQAKAAGLDGFKVYIYYGSGASSSDLNTWEWSWQTFEKMLAISAEEGFGIYIDDSKLEQMGTSTNTYTYADAVANLGFAAQHGYLSHPGYLKINGRPLYGMPVTNEVNPTAISNFVAQMNARYQLKSGKTNTLYTLVTAMTTWGEPNATGPYNMQELFFYPSYHVWQNWQRYFVCDPAPASLEDLLARGSCKYDPSQPASGYGVFLATLLERDELAGFRNLPGVTSLFDWCNSGAMLFPQYQLGDGYTFVVSGTPDTTTTLEAFRRYTADAHRYGYGSTITVIPGHDKSALFYWVTYEAIPRTEADGHTLRWRRMLQSALAAHPDVIDVENWNGYGEAVIIEPCEGFVDDDGNSNPDIYLQILAEALGKSYQAPRIPSAIVDPLRLPYIPTHRFDQPATSGSTDWNGYR